MDGEKNHINGQELKKKIIRACIDQETNNERNQFLVQTLWALAADKNPENIPQILKLVENGDENIRKEARKVLLAFGEDVADDLASQIKDGFPTSIPGALITLGLMGRLSDIELILSMTDNQDSTIRKSAVEALGLLGHPTPDIIRRLLDCLKDDDPELRCIASHALALLRHMDAACPMVLCAAEIEPFYYKESILDDVRALKNSEATPFLIEMIRTELDKYREVDVRIPYPCHEDSIHYQDLYPIILALEACITSEYCEDYFRLLHPNLKMVNVYSYQKRAILKDYFDIHRHLLKIAKFCGDQYAEKLSEAASEYLQEAENLVSSKENDFSKITVYPAYQGVLTLSTLGSRGKICAYNLLHDANPPSQLIIAMALSEDKDGLSSLLNLALESEQEEIRESAINCLLKGDLKEILETFVSLPARDKGKFSLNEIDFAEELCKNIFGEVMIGLFSSDKAKRESSVEYLLMSPQIKNGVDYDEKITFLRELNNQQMRRLQSTLCNKSLES